MVGIFLDESCQGLLRFGVEFGLPQAETVGVIVIARVVGLRFGNGANCSEPFGARLRCRSRRRGRRTRLAGGTCHRGNAGGRCGSGGGTRSAGLLQHRKTLLEPALGVVGLFDLSGKHLDRRLECVETGQDVGHRRRLGRATRRAIRRRGDIGFEIAPVGTREDTPLQRADFRLQLADARFAVVLRKRGSTRRHQQAADGKGQDRTGFRGGIKQLHGLPRSLVYSAIMRPANEPGLNQNPIRSRPRHPQHSYRHAPAAPRRSLRHRS